MTMRLLPSLLLCVLLSGCEELTDCRLVARAFAAQTLEQELAENVPEHEQRILEALVSQGAPVREGAEYASAYRLCMREYR